MHELTLKIAEVFTEAAILGLHRSPFLFMSGRRGRGITTFRSVLKSCADPDLLLMLVKMLLRYLQKTITILHLFHLLSVSLKLTLDE